MSQSTLTSPSTISPVNAMFTELYALREIISQAGVYTAATPKLTFDANWSVGLRVTPPGWGSSVAAFDFGTLGAVYSDSTTVGLRANSFNDGTNNKAKATGLGGTLQIAAGVLKYSNAASVSAGSNQTFVDHWSIDASGHQYISGQSALPSAGTTGTAWVRSVGELTSLQFRAASTSATASMSFYNSGGGVGSITHSGSATSYNTSSDVRLKENIVDAGDAGAKIDSIQIRAFDWVSSGEHVDHGVVAQELHEVAPEAVTVGGEDPAVEPWGVDPSKLVLLLVKEVQSLRARVAALEAT
jgi:hypothetical protein